MTCCYKWSGITVAKDPPAKKYIFRGGSPITGPPQQMIFHFIQKFTYSRLTECWFEHINLTSQDSDSERLYIVEGTKVRLSKPADRPPDMAGLSTVLFF